MTRPRSGNPKGTARSAARGTAAVRPAADRPRTLTDLLEGKSTSVVDLDVYRLQPKTSTARRPPVPTPRRPLEQQPPAELRPFRPVGLHAIVVELLERLATDDGVHVLSSTPGVPGSGAMNPVARAIGRAVDTADVWIGEGHEYVRVGRHGTVVTVELPERLRDLLDDIADRPGAYPDVRPWGRP